MFRIVHQDTRAVVTSPVAQVLREGVVVGLANHTALLARDGAEYAIADSGAPIRDRAGALRGVVLVFRDVTAEYAAAQQLRQALREGHVVDAGPIESTLRSSTLSTTFGLPLRVLSHRGRYTARGANALLG